MLLTKKQTKKEIEGKQNPVPLPGGGVTIYFILALQQQSRKLKLFENILEIFFLVAAPTAPRHVAPAPAPRS